MLEQSLRDLLNEVGKVSGRVGREFGAEPYQIAIVSLFDRGRSTFGAVRVLLDHDFAHEAVVLGRSLFTESLMLTELADVDEPRRVALVVGWWLAGLTSLRASCARASRSATTATTSLLRLPRDGTSYSAM